MPRSEHPKSIEAVDLPLFISAADGQPGYEQLARQLKSLIVSRTLKVGSRLPSSRALAASLGVNRNTVVAAFESLANAGLVETRGRGGTVVSDLSERTARRLPNAPTVRARSIAARSASREASEPQTDFRVGFADPSPLPLEVWRRACREAGRYLPPASYGDPRGDLELRKQIVLYLGRTRAMRIDPDDVVITAGAGPAIERIAEAMLGKNDRAALEEPGYPRAAQAFRRQGARLVPVPVDEDGIDTRSLCSLKQTPKILHVTPSHQYPTGALLSLARRQSLLRWANDNKVLIVENDYDGEFRYVSPPLPVLAALSGLENVAYVGTFSKVLTPAIRLGFLIARTELIDTVIRFIRRARDPVSIVTQRIVCWLIKSGELEKHIRRTRRQYALRRAKILESLKAIPTVESVSGHAAGLHVVVKLRPGIPYASLLSRLRRSRIAMDTVADCCLTRHPEERLLLAYGHLSERQIVEGTKRLAAAITD